MSEQQLVSADPNYGAASASSGAAPSAILHLTGQDNPASSSPLTEMLGALAHPQTLTDFARLLTLPVDSVKKALASAVAMRVGPPIAGDAISATGRGLEKVGTTLERPAEIGGGAAILNGQFGKGAAALVAPSLAKGAGRMLQRAGAAVSTFQPATAPAAVAASAPIAAEAEAPAAAVAESAPPAASVLAQAKPFLSGAEWQAAQKMVDRGIAPQKALDLVVGQRELAKRLGLPTPEQVRQSVAQRNATGRWPEE